VPSPAVVVTRYASFQGEEGGGRSEVERTNRINDGTSEFSGEKAAEKFRRRSPGEIGELHFLVFYAGGTTP